MSSISRRHFFIHSAHQTIGVSAGLVAWESAVRMNDRSLAEEPLNPLQLCLVSGSFEYQSDQSLAILQTHLEKHFAVQCSRAFAPSEEQLPGLENLDQCDAAIFFTRRLKINGEALERVKRYAMSGKPLLGIRTASHGFQNWLDMDREVFGGDYRGHYGNSLKPKLEIVAAAQTHPVLEGVEPFPTAGSLYKNPQIAADACALLRGSIPDHSEPVAWTREHRGGRVFYTSLGHRDDFQQPGFLRLLVNALAWTTARKLA
jgi:type 1 glutamine amidotransferase